uniref:Uncharacterized protein n=1 Tax=Aegilops tauschii subsp. strangulata TaxID=200361 RepID=A0A453SCR4_AEGTS
KNPSRRTAAAAPHRRPHPCCYTSTCCRPCYSIPGDAPAATSHRRQELQPAPPPPASEHGGGDHAGGHLNRIPEHLCRRFEAPPLQCHPRPRNLQRERCYCNRGGSCGR